MRRVLGSLSPQAGRPLTLAVSYARLPYRLGNLVGGIFSGAAHLFNGSREPPALTHEKAPSRD